MGSIEFELFLNNLIFISSHYRYNFKELTIQRYNFLVILVIKDITISTLHKID